MYTVHVCIHTMYILRSITIIFKADKQPLSYQPSSRGGVEGYHNQVFCMSVCHIAKFWTTETPINLPTGLKLQKDQTKLQAFPKHFWL